ncbi:MAG: alpha/beta fold hydrolase [Deltaproteobacteria bacterium]|nr:alpha/beta fold hydrolase [Deltaproteobacteria bacterium]
MTSSFAPPSPSLRFDLPNGISIAADVHGDPSHQPVLFLHGGGQTRHAWGNTAEALAEHGFYTICTDHRGHGESSWSGEGEYHVFHFVEDLQHLLAQLDQKPILVGASLGGIVSLLAETEQEESVAKGVILVDVTPRLETDGVARIIGFMKGGTHWDPKMLKTMGPGPYTEEDDRRLKERLQDLSDLDIPTMLVRGRLSDLVSAETATEFLEMVPHAEYVDLADAHHMVAGDRNDVFTETVKEFLLRRFPPEDRGSEDRIQRTSQ